jgi:guanylate kinase
MNAKGEFLEFAQVHGYCYGTPKQPILNWIEAGTDALLDIDVQGARQIRANGDPRIQGALADVFIMPSTIQELERRLRKRRTESDEQIALRLKRASGEMMAWRDYKYMILSGTMEEDLIKFRAIMRAERYLSGRMLYHGTGF